MPPYTKGESVSFLSHFSFFPHDQLSPNILYVVKCTQFIYFFRALKCKQTVALFTTCVLIYPVMQHGLQDSFFNCSFFLIPNHPENNMTNNVMMTDIHSRDSKIQVVTTCNKMSQTMSPAMLSCLAQDVDVECPQFQSFVCYLELAQNNTNSPKNRMLRNADIVNCKASKHLMLQFKGI